MLETIKSDFHKQLHIMFTKKNRTRCPVDYKLAEQRDASIITQYLISPYTNHANHVKRKIL